MSEHTAQYRRPSLKKTVVYKLFPNAIPLDIYLSRYLGVDINSAHAITSDPHTREELASVCKGVLVVPSSTIVLSSSFSVGVHVDRTSIQEVLNRLISRDVRSNSSRNQDRNVLSLGYRLKLTLDTISDAENFSNGWLHSGDECLHSLLSLAMFQPIGRGCFVQISGIAVPRLIYGQQLEQRRKPYSRIDSDGAAVEDDTTDGCKQESTLTGNTLIPRARLFYNNKRSHAPCIRCREAARSGVANTRCSCVEGFMGLSSTHVLRSKISKNVGRGLVIVGSINGLETDQVQQLDALLDSLKLNYFTCRVSRALNLYCPIHQVNSNDTAPSEALGIPQSNNVKCLSGQSVQRCEQSGGADEKVVRRRKTRRGCRGGSHVKNRRLSADAVDELLKISNKFNSIPVQEVIHNVDLLHTPVHRKRKRDDLQNTENCKKWKESIHYAVEAQTAVARKSRPVKVAPSKPSPAQRNTLTRRSLITVGQRLWRRIMSSARLGARYYKSFAEKKRALENNSLIDDNDVESAEFSSQLDFIDGEQVETTRCLENAASATVVSNFALIGTNMQVDGLHCNILDRRYFTQTSTQKTSSASGCTPSKTGIVTETPPCSEKSKLRRRTAYSAEDLIGTANYQDIASDKDRVSTFLRTICLQLFPMRDVWGSRKNMSLFLAGVDKYVRLGRGENLTLECVCHGIRLSKIPWLVWSPRMRAIADNQYREGCGFDRNYLLRSFMFWVYTEVLNPLLRTSFYITEGEAYGNEVLYYRHSLWRCLSHIGAAQLKENFIQIFPDSTGLAADGASMLNHVTAKTGHARKPIELGTVIVRPTQLSHIPSVRLVPKKRSMRPITNLRSAFLRNKPVVSNSITTAFSSSNICNSLAEQPRILKNKSGSLNTLPDAAVLGSVGSNVASSAPSPFLLTNATLYNILHVLRDMTNKSPHLYGFGVLGTDGIYLKLREYKKNLLCQNFTQDSDAAMKMLNTYRYTDLSDKKFYVATLDLDKCYDCMDTVQLFDLIQKLVIGDYIDTLGHTDLLPALGTGHDHGECDVDESCSLVHKYSVSHYIPSLEKKVVKSVKKVTKGNDLIPFLEAANHMCEMNRNCIITDGVIYPSLTRNRLLQLLKLHLFSHVVRIPTAEENNDIRENDKSGYSFFTQVKGIPQGSVLSPILCNIYYGDAETKEFGSEEQQRLLSLHNGKSVIIRMMDDYLMISTDKGAANHFLQAMHGTMKQYGGGVNPLKTRVNFDVDVCIDGQLHRLPRLNNDNSAPEIVIWCGWVINTTTLEIQPSFDKLLQRPISSSVSVGFRNCGTLLRHAMKSFLRPKCHTITLDPFLNSRSSIFNTVCSIFVVGALRSFSYLKSSGIRIVKGHHPCFVYRCISEAALYGAKLVKSRSPNILFCREDLCGGEAIPSVAVKAYSLVGSHEILRGFLRNSLFLQILCLAYMSFLKVCEKKSSYAVISKLLRKKIVNISEKFSKEQKLELERAVTSASEIMNQVIWK